MILAIAVALDALVVRLVVLPVVLRLGRPWGLAPAEVARTDPAQGEVLPLTRGHRTDEVPNDDEGGVTMELPDEVVEDLRMRLRRAGGQVHAVETMLAEGRECRDIVTQLSAATKALEQVGFRLIASGLTYCVAASRRSCGVRLSPRRGPTAVHQVGVSSASQQQ